MSKNVFYHDSTFSGGQLIQKKLKSVNDNSYIILKLLKLAKLISLFVMCSKIISKMLKTSWVKLYQAQLSLKLASLNDQLLNCLTTQLLNCLAALLLNFLAFLLA